MIKCEDELCKYHSNEKGCLFFYEGSGMLKDMPCDFTPKSKARWEKVRANRNGMIHCSNCLGSWWNEKYEKILEICPDCGADMRGDEDDER